MAQQGSGAVLGVRQLSQSAPEAEFDITSPAFAAHLGSLLEATRRRDGRSIRELAAAAGGDFGPGRLRRLERGSVPLDESVIEAMCRLYRTDLGAILPSRPSLKIEDRVMIVGGLRVAFERDDPTSVLSGYLRLVRAVRDQKKASEIALRRDDIERLAAYLRLDSAEVLDRLASLMGATVAQRIAIGSLFAAGAMVVGLVAASHADADGATASVPSVVVAVAIADSVSTGSVDSVSVVTAVDNTTRPQATPTAGVGAVGSIGSTTSAVAAEPSVATTVQAAPQASIPTTIDESTAAAGSDGLAPAVRLLPPVPAAPDTTAVENRSGCNTDAVGAVMSLTIPDLSYVCPVHAGGQSQIDAGFVTLVTAAGANAVLATRPGAPGTLWLAAHRASNGAPFADVPDLADGALIRVADGGASATYRVVGRSYVEVRDDQVVDASGTATATATWESIIRSDMSGNLAPRLVLQTCEGTDFRWMIYADLVT